MSIHQLKTRIKDVLKKIQVSTIKWVKNNKEDILSLKWASKLLALVISLIAGFILLSALVILLIGLFGGGMMMLVREFPRIIFMVGFSAIAIFFIIIGTKYFPKLKSFFLNFLMKNNGKTHLVWFVFFLWFTAIFHRLITEKPAHLHFALTLIMSSLILMTVAIVNILTLEFRKKVLSAAAGFICIILFYAGVYNFIFLNSPLSFIFSDSIIEGAIIQNNFNQKILTLKKMNLQLYSSTVLEKNYQQGYSALLALRENKDSSYFELDSLFKIRFVWVPDGSHDEIHLFAKHFDEEMSMAVRYNGINHPEHEAIFDIYTSDSEYDFVMKIRALSEIYQTKIKRLRSQIESTISKRPEWDFLDFCYFSSMTQTSAGFGEIIPNTSFVRVIVLSQAVLGIIYIGFVISFIANK